MLASARLVRLANCLVLPRPTGESVEDGAHQCVFDNRPPDDYYDLKFEYDCPQSHGFVLNTLATAGFSSTVCAPMTWF